MLTIEKIHKLYEGNPLLRGVSFQVGQGKRFACWVLPAAARALLRIIAGLEGLNPGGFYGTALT